MKRASRLPPGKTLETLDRTLGHALVQRGHSVLFTPTFRLVQELLAAKRDLALPRALQRLDAFELLICDDIGYVQQSADEVEVLFTLMAERYERRSLVITSNLVFGEGDRIFKNPMTTAAAIDRLVDGVPVGPDDELLSPSDLAVISLLAGGKEKLSNVSKGFAHVLKLERNAMAAARRDRTWLSRRLQAEGFIDGGGVQKRQVSAKEVAEVLLRPGTRKTRKSKEARRRP